MKLRTIIATPFAVVAAGVLLTACGQASGVAGTAQISPAAATDTVASADPAPEPTVTAAKAAAPVAQVAQVGAFGPILVGEGGRTLYAFTKDADGQSTCVDACANAWPALTVPAGFVAPTGVDPTLVSTVDRPDGSKQLKVGKWPLYYYSGDGAQGETNGQGVGGVWFVIKADGTLIKGDGAAPAAESATTTTAAPAPEVAAPAAAAGPVVDLAPVGNLGEVMVGANGHTLYAFTDDPEKQSSCFDACAKAWPPLAVPGDFTISPELQASGASTIERPDGTKQLVMGKWALYYYSGDGAPGEANGQGIGGKWFAVEIGRAHV